TQMLYQFRHFHTQKSVIESVSQICLREASGNHQRNAFGFERSDSLLAAGASSEIEAAHDHVALLSARCKLRIVTLHNYFGHYLRGHVVAVSVVFPVNGVGI